MADEKYLAILRQGLEVWNKWRGENPDTQPDLSGVDLHGADLSGADLWGADLNRAKLNGADLSEAFLYRVDLCEADLSGANLSEAELCALCRQLHPLGNPVARPATDSD